MITGNSARLIMRSFHQSRRLNALIPFKLADIGEGITEVELIQWHVQEGMPVKQFDKIAEVQSDKANVEITSRFDGVVKKLHYEAGQVARVGSPLIDIEVEQDSVSVPKSDDFVQAAEEFRDEVLNSAVEVEQEFATKKYVTDNSDVKALPSVRRKAKELGVNLSLIRGTGSKGQITLEDVLKSQGKPASSKQVPLTSKIVPLNVFQKSMVKTMNESIRIPHFGFNDEISVDRLNQVRSEINQSLSETERLTPLPFIVKALSMALNDFPLLNGNFRAEQNELILFNHHNIGVAVDTGHGLAVPVIKDVARKSVKEIALELNRLTLLARSNKLPQSDMTGGTLTVSNIGTIGGTTASPIIPPSQLAIVALGRAQRIPRFDKEGKLVGVSLMSVSWSADHRVVDGATIARFSQRWKQLIESPSLILIK